jgi:hypothetical protein
MKNAENTETAEIELLKLAAQNLGEHFEAVHIFASRDEPEEGGTVRYSYGLGNWFARYGQVREWILREEENARCVSRKDYEEGRDPDNSPE